ncbi:hypothetical protein HK101_001983, partial [Irineochytrium annulatum]
MFRKRSTKSLADQDHSPDPQREAVQPSAKMFARDRDAKTTVRRSLVAIHPSPPLEEPGLRTKPSTMAAKVQAKGRRQSKDSKPLRFNLKLSVDHRSRFNPPYDDYLNSLLDSLDIYLQHHSTIPASVKSPALQRAPRGSKWTVWISLELKERFGRMKELVVPGGTHSEFVEVLLMLRSEVEGGADEGGVAVDVLARTAAGMEAAEAAEAGERALSTLRRKSSIRRRAAPPARMAVDGVKATPAKPKGRAPRRKAAWEESDSDEVSTVSSLTEFDSSSESDAESMRTDSKSSFGEDVEEYEIVDDAEEVGSYDEESSQMMDDGNDAALADALGEMKKDMKFEEALDASMIMEDLPPYLDAASHLHESRSSLNVTPPGERAYSGGNSIHDDASSIHVSIMNDAVATHPPQSALHLEQRLALFWNDHYPDSPAAASSSAAEALGILSSNSDDTKDALMLAVDPDHLMMMLDGPKAPAYTNEPLPPYFGATAAQPINHQPQTASSPADDDLPEEEAFMRGFREGMRNVHLRPATPPANCCHPHPRQYSFSSDAPAGDDDAAELGMYLDAMPESPVIGVAEEKDSHPFGGLLNG